MNFLSNLIASSLQHAHAKLTAQKKKPRQRKSMKGRRFLSIPVFSVFLVLGFVYYATVFIFLEDWLGLQTSAGSLNALIFTFLAFLSLFSFFACVLTDPGGVPSSYVPDVEDSGVADQELKKTVSSWMIFVLVVFEE